MKGYQKVSVTAVVLAFAIGSASIALRDARAQSDGWSRGAVDGAGVSVDPTKTEGYNAPRIWHAKFPSDTVPIRPRPCRIVSYADKWTTHHMSGYMCWRFPNGPLSSVRVNQGRVSEHMPAHHDFDVDGDGETEDDFVAALDWSLEIPLSNPNWPLALHFPERRSSTFYGGVSRYLANTDPRKVNFCQEMGYNPDHACFPDRRSEDHPLCASASERDSDSALRAYYAIVWKKEDFLNAGDRYRVTFDDSSRLASMCTRGYYIGWDDVRYIVRDGDDLYISDTDQFEIPTTGYEPMYGRIFLLKPTEATWARYEPQGHLVHFDAQSAEFGQHEFKDIRGVGWYLGKDNLEGKLAHLKWYGAEFDAVVHRPAMGSVNINMVEVPGEGGIDPFWMATCEMPYDLFRDVHDYGDAPFHTLEARYVYRKDGAMGSMQYSNRLGGEGEGVLHTPDEPATDMTWYDALAICNTLSEMEGRTPCYYLDESCTEVFRNQHLMVTAYWPEGDSHIGNPAYAEKPEPTVYVRWSADGFRIPTAAEWQQAAGIGTGGAVTDAGKTAPVGSLPPNPLGIHDLVGNAWEWVWTSGDSYDPKADRVAIAGGAFTDEPVSPFGDRPFLGSGSIGLRLIRRRAGLQAPDVGRNPTGRQVLTAFSRDEKTPAVRRNVATDVEMEMRSIPAGEFPAPGLAGRLGMNVTVSPFEMAAEETTFARWNAVRQWAEAHGYEFSYDGDMGSMYWYRFPHRGDEPVTRITWYDALVWCNALSEMQGRTPAYYADRMLSQVLRRAYVYRPGKVDGWDYISADDADDPYRDTLTFRSCPWVFCAWDVDGYRLPTAAEFRVALSDQPGYIRIGEDYGWTLLNSGGRTHPVAGKKANARGIYDLYGNVREWLWCGLEAGRGEMLDLSNPKGQPLGEYGKWHPGRQAKAATAGGSWVKGENADVYDGDAALYYYPHLGFRVVRCKAGTHPRDGREPLVALKYPVIMEVDAGQYDPLQGQCYRANLKRTGAYESEGPRTDPVVKWKTDLGGPVAGSPVCFGGAVYVGSGTGFHCLDADSGRIEWSIEIAEGVTSSPCVVDGRVYYGGRDGRLYCVEADSGEILWTVNASGPITSSPAVSYGTVFIDGRHGAAWGFDARTGEQVWQTVLGSSLAETRGGYRGCLALDGGVLVGRSSVIDIPTGKVTLYAGAMGATGSSYSHEENTDVIAGDTFLNVASGVGTGKAPSGINCFRFGRTRDAAWTQSAEHDYNPASRHCSLTSPAVWEGICLLGNDNGCLYGLDMETGDRLWRLETGGAVRSSPGVAARSGAAYVGSRDGRLYALDARTGKRLFAFETGGAVDSSPCVADGVVYFGSDDGHVYALRSK